MLNSLIDRFQTKFPPNRLTALAMLVLAAPAAALGGYVAVWVPKHFPGLPTFTPKQYTGFLVTGAGVVALAGISAGYKFLDGWQKDEHDRRGAAIEAAQRDHEAHLEAMRLESRERIAIAERAGSSDEAAEVLGHALDAPGAALRASMPASPPPVKVSAPAPGSFGSSQLPDRRVAEELRETTKPPVPPSPHDAAQRAHGEKPIN